MDNKTPGPPVISNNSSKQLPRMWTLYYRYGTVPQLQKTFIHEGDLLAAINRAREHCVKMGYRFICVRPFLIDLEEQEQRRLKGDEDV